MNGLPRDARRIAVPLLVLFAALAVLGVSLVVGESRRSRLLTEYEAERVASQLVESIRERGTEAEEGDGLDERILGFGLYGPRGTALSRWGNTPESLRGADASPVFEYDAAGRSLSLTRPLGMMPAMLPDAALRGQRPKMLMPQARAAMGFLYLSVDIRDYYRRRGLLIAAAILVPLVAASMAAAFLLLLASNARYRRAAGERETLARLGESARTLAHEIRNPLSAIRIQAGILRQGLPDDGSAERAAVDAIDEETERLAALSRRVGDFLRNPAGSPRVLDLGDFLAEVAERSPHRPRYVSRAEGVLVSFDPELLRSSVENLLRNARESYGEAEGEQEVELELSRDPRKREGRAIISVRDRGPGIEPEAREKVFDPFFTGKVHGYGIGLPLSRRFVEAAGGSLSLSPREGGGTEARIELPIAEGS